MTKKQPFEYDDSFFLKKIRKLETSLNVIMFLLPVTIYEIW